MILQDANAVIFDVDGVLVDSESIWEKSHTQALAEVGVVIDTKFYIHHGVSREPREFYAEAFIANKKQLTESMFQRIHTRRAAIYEAFLHTGPIVQMQEAVELVERLFALGKPLAVASAAQKEELYLMLQKINVLKYFSVITAGGEYGLPRKPAPDVYLKTAELLGVLPKECVAIEDSRNGARSAVDAGMACFVVPNRYTKDHEFPQDALVTSFSKLLDSLH